MRLGNDPGEDVSGNTGKRPPHPPASPDRPGPAKRSRVSRACDQCRASREKCDGTQPKCQTCTAQRRECSYHEQPKKRGIQPNYIRTLELIIAWQLKYLPGGESQLAAHLAAADDSVHQVISAKNGSGAEALHQRWRNSIICRQIDQMLSGAPIESPAINEASLQIHEISSSSAAQVDSAPVTAPASSAELHAKRRGRAVSQLTAGHCSDADRSASIAPRLKLPESTWTLLEYYFAFTHSWMPIIEKQSILKSVYTWPADGVTHDLLLQVDSGYGELCCILALSAAQLERSGQGQSHAQTKELQEVASRCSSADGEKLHISFVRIAILQAVRAMVSQDWTGAWFLIGRAVRVLLRLDATPAGSVINPSDPKPVELVAFVLEAAVASHLGIRSSHLRPEHVEKVGLLNEDGGEEWSPWHDPLASNASKAPALSLSTLNRLVRLTLQSFNSQGFLHSTSSSVSNSEAPLPSRLAAFGTDPPLDPSTAAFDVGQAPGIPNATLHSPSHRAVLALMQNSLAKQDRLQPMSIVASCEAGPLHFDAISDMTLNFTAAQQQPLGYISIPKQGAESVLSASPNMLRSGKDGAGLWPDDGSTNVAPANALSLPSEGTGTGADIFEELALLDRNDSNHNPQFLQNLGFAPDLDLAEFFGSDYQPSDPLLAYMQPSYSGIRSGSRANEPG